MEIGERKSKRCMRTVLFVFTFLIVVTSSLSRVHSQQKALDFTLTDIDGEEFALADFRGTSVVLTFLATRVITCKMQALILNNVSRYFEDDITVVLIGISDETLWVGGDTDEQLKKFREDCCFGGIVARDTEGVAEFYDVTYIPATFIIDQEGYIRHKHVGVVQTSELVLLQELQVIVPEFSSTAVLLTFMILSVLSIAASAHRFRQQKDDCD